MNVLVTGGAGFIGSHIVDRLVRKHHVKVYDDFSTGKYRNRFSTIIEGDILDKVELRKACKDIDVIIHLASKTSVVESCEDPQSYYEVGSVGTFNVLQAALDNKCKRVVYASSSSCYGDKDYAVKETDRLDPLSPYAMSKIMGEGHLNYFNRYYGLSTVVLRYFNVFGPRQQTEGGYPAVIPAFIKKVLKNEPLTVFGTGKQKRDFVYVAEIAKMNELALDKVQDGTYNVASGKSITILELIKEISKVYNWQVDYNFAPAREGEVFESSAIIDKACGQGFHYKGDFKSHLKEVFKDLSTGNHNEE